MKKKVVTIPSLRQSLLRAAGSKSTGTSKSSYLLPKATHQIANRKPMKISRQHVERIIRYNGPPTPLIITRTASQTRLQLSLCDPTWNPSQILHSTITSIYACFTQTHVHPDRILYIASGLVFVADSPLPFGGPKTLPGYVQYTGSTPQDLLEYIVSSAYKFYWGYRGKMALA
ncbi:UNVERIFIED_CONTAM: hypothetical protein HDU68_010722, partial [Siphonaria sp. JEL0065]